MMFGRRWCFVIVAVNLQRQGQCGLNFSRGFLTGFTVRNDAGHFRNLGDITFVARFRAVPDAYFVILGGGIHGWDFLRVSRTCRTW